MLSLLEKMLVLKAVAIFADTPDDVLLAIAAIVAEEEHRAGARIFAQGDPGSSMYVIVRGLLQVHDEQRTLNQLGPRDVFGEMAMLDPEPRVASVTALEDTLLLRIDHRPFYDLLADRTEVIQGLIRVLAGYVRDRLDDLDDVERRLRVAAP
jgi:CRP-like cAMP-binding protein